MQWSCQMHDPFESEPRERATAARSETAADLLEPAAGSSSGEALGVTRDDASRQAGVEPGRRAPAASASGAAALGAAAIGALAIGAFAIGAMAIGRLAVGRLSMKRARVHTVRIDDLEVGRLRVGELIVEPDAVAHQGLE